MKADIQISICGFVVTNKYSSLPEFLVCRKDTIPKDTHDKTFLQIITCNLRQTFLEKFVQMYLFFLPTSYSQLFETFE